ncbi:MAG TPA: DHA2 family efflux MFS transporter permease subunit [Streptosporangiaceae bacterium]|nr:DHA2 family efflux MFS transporter permease subunit [Streptosporangiaceae bacterium]
MTATAARPASGHLSPAVQYALLAGPLLSMLDSSVVNVAIEPIARQLHASLPLAQWTVSGYLLALGTGLAATAYLSRRLGTLRLYQASVTAFTITSVVCALAPTVQLLLLARVAQGLAAAPLVPMAMSMLFGKGESARSMPAVAGMLLFLGPALGPSVGGALIGAAGWRSIFLINLPTGVAAVLAVRRIPAGLAPPRLEQTRLDVAGLLLLAAGLALLLLGITVAGTARWTATGSWLPMLLGAGLLAGYTRWARRAAEPALNLALARSRQAALALALCAAASVATFSVVFLLPVFVQSVQGHSPLGAGLAMLPQGIITGLSTTLGQRALRLVTVRTTVATGFALLTAASLGLLAIGSGTPLSVTAALLAARSVSIGLVISPLLAVFTGSLGAEELSDASTLFSICQRIAGSLGVGLIAAIYARQTAIAGATTALHQTGLVIAAVAAGGLIAAPLLPAHRNQMRYRPAARTGCADDGNEA